MVYCDGHHQRLVSAPVPAAATAAITVLRRSSPVTNGGGGDLVCIRWTSVLKVRRESASTQAVDCLCNCLRGAVSGGGEPCTALIIREPSAPRPV